MYLCNQKNRNDMCKFCEGKETLGREGRRIFMNEYGQLVYLGEHTIFGDVIGEVKFCPVCGKPIKNSK